MILRENYLKKIREFYDSDLIKIITGMRRCGKSVILSQIMEEIKKNTDNIIYLNFEDNRVINKISNDIDLLKYIDENKNNGKCYIFLDEVQVLDGWQDACKTLRLYDNSLFITVSNSKLLSREFTKELSGRYVSFRVRPFVFKEIMEYSAELKKECSVIDYLIWGEIPKRLEFNDKDSVIKYLNEIDDIIVINDLINRYNIRKTSLFKKIVNFILLSNSRIISTKSIFNYLKETQDQCSINTIIKYLDYLEEAYIIEKVKQYSTKTKSNISYFEKVYNADVALNSIRCFDKRYDLTHNLENIVYNELLYRGYSLMVYNNNGKEIDFLASKDGRKYYVQVAYSVLDEKVYSREFGVFSNMDNSHEKIIITNDDIDYSTSTVRHIRLKDFLIMDSLDE